MKSIQHIAETTHEHATSAKVYVYEADYEIEETSIAWQAQVRQGDRPPREISGSIPMTSPALATLAQQAVRDAILKEIDKFDESH